MFGIFKKLNKDMSNRGHIVRDERGIMVAKISMNALESLFSSVNADSISLNEARTHYVFKGYEDGDGFSISKPGEMKLFIWDGYTIECATTKL